MAQVVDVNHFNTKIIKIYFCVQIVDIIRHSLCLEIFIRKKKKYIYIYKYTFIKIIKLMNIGDKKTMFINSYLKWAIF